MSSFDSNSDFGTFNSRKRDTRMASSRGRNMSSRRKYQNGSRYRSKRKSEFHWGYVAVPAVVGVAGVTTLAIVLSKNKSKPGKDGAQGAKGETVTGTKVDGGEKGDDGANGETDEFTAEVLADSELTAKLKAKLRTHNYFSYLVGREYNLRYITPKKDVGHRGFKHPQNAAGRWAAEDIVFLAFLNDDFTDLGTEGKDAKDKAVFGNPYNTKVDKDDKVKIIMDQVKVQSTVDFACRELYGLTTRGIEATYETVDKSWDLVNAMGWSNESGIWNI